MEVSMVTSPKDAMVFLLSEELYYFGLTNVDILQLHQCICCCNFKLMMCGLVILQMNFCTSGSPLIESYDFCYMKIIDKITN